MTLLAQPPPAGAPAGRLTRGAWLLAGWACLATGTVGIVVPLLPTVDFYGLAALCFARGSRRWEAWLLNHARLGPLVRDWRTNRSVPLSAKWLATASMSASCAWAAATLAPALAALAIALCLAVATWLWRRPSRAAAAPAPGVSVRPRSAHADAG